VGVARIVKAIRSCRRGCYRDSYDRPIVTFTGREYRPEQLRTGTPVIDDWRGQRVLYVSDSPCAQTYVEGGLSSPLHDCLSCRLLPKIFPDLKPDESFRLWHERVFWFFASCCHPAELPLEGVHKTRRPSLKCAALYLDKLIELMKPRAVLLMGWNAARCFAPFLRRQFGLKTPYPRCNQILHLQYANRTLLQLGTKTGRFPIAGLLVPRPDAESHPVFLRDHAYRAAAELILGTPPVAPGVLPK
jgi:uracil-DNA glycosylase